MCSMVATDSHGALLQWMDNTVTMDSCTYSAYTMIGKPSEFHNKRAALKLK